MISSVSTSRRGWRARASALCVLACAATATWSVPVAARAHHPSPAALIRIDDQVRSLARSERADAVVQRWGIDAEHGRVVVGVHGASGALSSSLHERFGRAVRVVTVPRLYAMSGRETDTPAFYGGDDVTDGPGSCTSGFAMRNLYGTPYEITAGHCFPTGYKVWVTGDSSYEGTVDYRRKGNDGYDNELIGGSSYGGRIWVGATTTSLSYPVHGAANSCTGCNVNFDGAYSGKAVGTLTGSSYCGRIYESKTVYYTACGLQNAKPADGRRLCRPGDSGGPVFAYDGKGGVTAVGIITASPSDGSSCTYTRLPSILAYWKATILTE